MEKQANILDIKIIVIDKGLESLPEGLDNSELSVLLFNHIPPDINILIAENISIILTSEIDTCRHLVAQDIDCPVYILLEEVTASKIDEVFEAGANDYLCLPVHKQELLARIRQYIAPIAGNVETLQVHHEAEARYTEMIENAGDAILVLQNDRIIYANRGAYELMGYDNNKLHNQLIWSYIAPDFLETMQTAFIQFSRDEVTTGRFEIQIIKQQNILMDVELTVSRTQYADEPAFTIFMHDISERKFAKYIVQKTQDRLQAQAESLITINQIADSLHHALDINELANTAVDVCRKYLGAELAVFYIADYDEQGFNLIASDGTPESDSILVPKLSFSDSLTGKLINEKRILISEDLAGDERLHSPTKDALLQSKFVRVISIPALHNGRVLAAMNLLFRQSQALTDETFTTLQSIGQTLGLALSNASTVELLVQEIKERQEVEKALILSNKRLNSVITTVPVILFAVDEKGIFTLSRGRGLDLLEFDADQAVGKSIVDLYPDNPDIHRAFNEAIAGIRGHIQVEIKDITFDVYYSPMENAKGATGVCIDVSERTRAERLQNTLFNISQATSEATSLDKLWVIIQRELSQLLDTRNFYVALYDPLTKLYSFPFWQDEFSTGTSEWQPQAMPRSLTDYVRRTGQVLMIDDKEHKQMYQAGLVDYDEDASTSFWLGVPLKTSSRIIGIMAIQSYQTRPYDDRDLEVMRYIGENIAWVIESKESEEALRLSEERFSKAFYNSPDAVSLSIVSTGKILDTNAGFKYIFAYTREEVIGKTFHELGIYDIPDEREIFVTRLKEEGVIRNMEIRARTKLGELRICLVSAEMITLGGEDCILSIARDVTESKKAEQALQTSEETSLEFQKRLKELHEISFELTGMDKLDDIYRRAIETGRNQLGFDRIALFLVDIKNDIVKGTFGTDTTGTIRDEREFRTKLSDDPKISTIIMQLNNLII